MACISNPAFMIFSNIVVSSNIPHLYIIDIRIEQAHYDKHLRLILTSSLSWTKHISIMSKSILGTLVLLETKISILKKMSRNRLHHVCEIHCRVW